MRKAIHHTTMPDKEGKVWFPKPEKTSHKFMTWLINYQQWEIYIGKIKI